jgi:hypothetical protein
VAGLPLARASEAGDLCYRDGMGRALFIVALTAVLSAAAPVAVAEWTPPPTLEEMLGSECIVVGRFVEAKGGALRFSLETVLRGSEETALRLAMKSTRQFQREADGPALWSTAMATRLLNNRIPVDPMDRWIWFFSESLEPEVQPCELADGYRALLRKTRPGLLFRLLQGLEPDMEWAAMEELVAKPDPAIVDRLHELAQSGYREVILASVEVLRETGLIDRERLPTAGVTPEPTPNRKRVPLDSLPPWTEEDEIEFLLDRLTSHEPVAFIMESAGRELARHHFARGFAELKKRLRQDEVYNTDMVMDGLGHLRHPEVLDFLEGYMATVPVVHRTFNAGLTAIGRQDSKRSFGILRAVLEARLPHGPGAFGRRALIESYGLMSDPRAKAELKKLGGPAPVQDLAALRDEVAKTWPKRSRERWGFARAYATGMQNFAGPSRRRGALAEVARQDPAWLAGTALERMGSGWRAARQAGEAVFRQLTGRSFGYRAEAFEGDRLEPLEKLRTWWAENGEKTRGEWLLSYFRENGFRMDRLCVRDAIPVLSRALESDFTTHCLAVEQISVIAGKFFTRFPTSRGHADQERMTVRVRSWLTASGYLK